MRSRKFRFDLNDFVRAYVVIGVYACAICVTFAYGLLFACRLFKNNLSAGIIAVAGLILTAFILYSICVSIANYDDETRKNDNQCCIPVSYIADEITRLKEEANTFNERKKKENARKKELLAKAETYTELIKKFKE
ncbi:MAG: hypothetical protein IJI66_10590 [Erysipelotrichaceae bacterium]|nr:hypothetical protein [Erysipelotrichaceae bacterium]